MSDNTPPGLDKINLWTDDMRIWPNVMYGDVFNYLILSQAVDGEAMKNYKSLESYNHDKTFLMKAEVRSSQQNRQNVAYVHCKEDGTILQGWCKCMAGQCHSCSHVGAILWKMEYAVRNNLTGIACTDETADKPWNSGTTRNVEPKAMANIVFKKPKLGEGVIENDNYVPSVRDTPHFTTDTEFKTAVTNSKLLKLYNIKGTTANKSFTCVPMTKSVVQIEHGDHLSLDSCTKCNNFYTGYVLLSDDKIRKLENSTKGQSASVLWRDSRKVRITASTANKTPVKDTTDATNFIREHLHPKFIGNKLTK